MTLQQRQKKLIKQISDVRDDEVLIMMEQELSFFNADSKSDILDGLNLFQVNELISLANEPSEKNSVNEVSYMDATRKWRLK